jgi:hypothetical protein
MELTVSWAVLVLACRRAPRILAQAEYWGSFSIEGSSPAGLVTPTEQPIPMAGAISSWRPAGTCGRSDPLSQLVK